MTRILSFKKKKKTSIYCYKNSLKNPSITKGDRMPEITMTFVFGDFWRNNVLLDQRHPQTPLQSLYGHLIFDFDPLPKLAAEFLKTKKNLFFHPLF